MATVLQVRKSRSEYVLQASTQIRAYAGASVSVSCRVSAVRLARSNKVFNSRSGHGKNIFLVHCLPPVKPNPSFEARPNIKTPGPHNGLALFSIVRAWGFAAGPASTRTLGITKRTCGVSGRKCGAQRRGSKSHGAA